MTSASPRRTGFAIVVSLILLPLAALHAQDEGDIAAAALHEAVRAQARFEATRIRHLPVRHGGGDGCDERIGRLCYWYDPNTRTEMPDEPAAMSNARRVLQQELADALRRSPGDGWILGQRIRYLIEEGQLDSAAAQATLCSAAGWWCEAMRAFVLHSSHDSAADSVFLGALATQPDDIRCEWTDLTVLLSGQHRRSYSRLPCGDARDSANAVFWWLARPLHARSGNELRAEYHARLSHNMLQQGARNPYGMRWSSDMAELALRYGWSRKYTRAPLRTGEASPNVTGHEPLPAFAFSATDEVLLHPLLASSTSWEHSASRARMRYSPIWATTIERAEAQVTLFRRGDSALVLSVASMPADSRGTAWWAGLAASTGPHSGFHRDSTITNAGSVTLTVMAPLQPLLVSTEIVAQEATAQGATERDTLPARIARAAEHPPGWDGSSIALSVPLLLQPQQAVAANDRTSLDQVLSRVLGGTTIEAPGRLGVFWEAYGLPPGRTPVQFSLVMHGGKRGWLRRLGDRITGNAPSPPPLLSWSDLLSSTVPDASAPAAGDVIGAANAVTVAAREVTLELPALAPGEYALELRMVLENGSSVSAVRVLNVKAGRR
ncbi:MAG TPA: hypothetical protein VKZ41_03830 [Gemmatimonadales bacterium]|nr:hypothetical protein [Gemmatimonadales bacterium]